MYLYCVKNQYKKPLPYAQRYSKKSDWARKISFFIESPISDRKIKDIHVDFDAPDISSNGGLLLMDSLSRDFIRKLAGLIPDRRNQDLIVGAPAKTCVLNIV